MPTLFPFYLNVAAKVTLRDISGAIQFDVDNLGGDGLRMEWNVERLLTPEADQGVMRIFNLGKLQQGLMEAIVRASEGFTFVGSIKLSIGWDKLAFELIDAQIWKLRPRIFEDPDVVTEIEFGDGTISSRDAIPPPFAFSNADVLSILSTLAAGFDPPRLLDNAQVEQAIATSPNRLRLIGSWDGSGENPVEQFSTLVATFGPDFSWGYGPRGLIVVYNRGLLLSAAASVPEVLRPDTGLMNFTIEDDGSVMADALANPAVIPGGTVAITDRFSRPVGEPFMRVEQVSFAGNTNDTSVMSVLSRPLGAV